MPYKFKPSAHTLLWASFDRILAAQAIHEDLILLSNGAGLDKFAVRREW
jgi:PIN domain nuclease of toxin-antitoxin system